MRKVGAWGLAATVVMGMGVARAADGNTWGSTWHWSSFGSWPGQNDDKEEKKPVEKKPAPKPEQPAAVKKPSVSAKPTSIVDDAAAERRRQEAVLLRRLQACDKLKEIALRTNDNALLRRAEELEERAQTCYTQRTAKLPGATGRFESDEKTLERYLGAGKAGSAEVSPYVVSGKEASSQAAVKEVEP
jgi:hypothetical protein